jgi:hypothetical protein
VKEPSGSTQIKPHEWQRRALGAFLSLGGLCCAMPVGSGKSWVGAKCAETGSRSVVVVPSALLDQAAEQYRAYGVNHARFVSYSKISRNATLLHDLDPDVLVLDEAHYLKNTTTSAWGRRVAKFLSDRPGCRVVAMTGSIMQRSLKDYAPLLIWALRSRAPCPRTRAGFERFAIWADSHPQEWSQRLQATPGVFLDGVGSWEGELTLTITRLGPADWLNYERAQTLSLAPDDWPLEDRWSREECLRQLAWGFCLVRSPRPSKRLLEARRVWARYVKQAIERYGVDTELLARGVFPDAYAKYLFIEQDEPASEQRVEWQASPSIETGWLKPGTIIWVGHIALGEFLSADLGLPYHREGARDAAGVYLGDQTAPVAIASIAACHRGVDGAQLRYDKHVVLEPPADARVWEQLLGRLARQNQPSSTVRVEVVLRCPEHEAAFASALEQARGIEEATRQSQLLLRARKTDPHG